MSRKGHVLEYADRLIRYSYCFRTNTHVILMETPVYHGGKELEPAWVTVNAADFGQMLADGLSPELIKLDGGPVAAPYAGRFVAIGCYLMKAGTKQNVTYLDGDCFNLRRDNLALVRETKRSQLAGPYLGRDYPLAVIFPPLGSQLPRHADRPVMQLHKEALRAVRDCFEEASRVFCEQASPGLDRVFLKSSTGGRK